MQYTCMYNYLYIYIYITYKMTACRWLVDRPLNGDLTRRYDFETQKMGIEWTNHEWLMIDLWLWGGCYLTYARLLEKNDGNLYQTSIDAAQVNISEYLPIINLTCHIEMSFLNDVPRIIFQICPEMGIFRCQVRLPEIKYRRATCGNGFGRWIQSWKHWNTHSMSCFEVGSSDSYPNST